MGARFTNRRTDAFARQRGATLIEVMIAGALVIVAATAVFPIFGQTSKMTKGSEFRETCLKAVRGKIAQYQSGNLARADYAVDGQVLNSNIHHSVRASGYQSLGQGNGFMFAKYIYNVRNSNLSATPDCIGDGERATRAATYPPLAPAYLGTQEAFGSPTTPTALPGPVVDCAKSCGGIASACPCPEDKAISQQLGSGFKIYVNIQRIHSLGESGVDTGADCPSEGIKKWTALGLSPTLSANHYNFDGATDAIKVTATALYDFNEAGARRDIAGITNDTVSTGSLTCTATEILKPQANVARYILGSYVAPEEAAPGDPSQTPTGWITKAQCAAGGSHESRCDGGAIMDISGRPAFMALWNANNRGINIAPNNRAVYVLKESGEIYRYGDETRAQTLNTTCIGASPECTTDTSNTLTAVLPETLIARIPSLIAFSLQYEQIVDASGGGDNFSFRPTAFYGVVSDQSGVKLAYAPIPSLAEAGTDITASITTDPAAIPTGLNKFAMPPGTLTKGFDSWFMNFKATQAYVLVNNCKSYGSGGAASITTVGSSYCSAIYRFEDATNIDNAAPIERLKFNIRAFSP